MSKYTDGQKYRFGRKISCDEQFQAGLRKFLEKEAYLFPSVEDQEEYDRQVELMMDIAIQHGLYQVDADPVPR